MRFYTDFTSSNNADENHRDLRTKTQLGSGHTTGGCGDRHKSQKVGSFSSEMFNVLTNFAHICCCRTELVTLMKFLPGLIGKFGKFGNFSLSLIGNLIRGRVN